MFPSRHLLTVLPIAIVAMQPARARADESFPALADRSMAEMNGENWPAALTTLDLIIAKFGTGEPLRTFGPQFGTIWFRKGTCELKLRKWADAAKSFEICYRDFPNPPPPGNGNTNVFQKLALLKWGEAAMGAGQWELAISQFRKFLEERDKTTDTYPPGAFYVNVAICNYKLGRIPPGNLNLEIAISNKENFPTPDTGIVAGFEALVGSAITTKNERALVDFIRKNRGGITFEPFEMGTFSSIYMRLGADAFAAEMPAAALAIYQLVPSSEAVIDDLRARIAGLGPLAESTEAGQKLVRQSLEANLAETEADYRGAAAPEIIKLAAAALIHEKHGNLRGAHAAYSQLVQFFPDAARREDYLFNLIRSAIAIGQPKEDIAANTTLLLREFPNSPSAPAARQLSLTSLFESGKYDDALKIAADSIAGFKDGTPEHDLCLHVLGGSLYYTGQNGKARPLLDQHIAKYPASPYAQAALYFQASNLAKLRAWDEACPLLDAFLEKFPDPKTNIFLPFALYDRAACHFADGRNDEALADISRLEKEFPASSISETALTLQGNIQRAAGKSADAKKSYLAALDLAETRKNRPVAGEVLANLVSLLATSAPKEAVTFADRFWKDHAEKSSFKPQVAIAQLKPLVSQNRREEALARLAQTIAELAKTDRAYTLESTVKAYASAYLADHSPEELQVHFDAFPGIDPNDQATRALLRMAVIGEFEQIAKTTKDPAAAQAARAKILNLFQQLKSSLSPKELPTPILLKLADHLRSNTSAPREALPFYEEAISRNESTYRFPSLFGRGDTWSRSGSPEELQKGIDDFETIFRQSKSRPEREYALFRIIETRVAKGDHAQAIKDAAVYSDPKSRFTKFTPEVGLLLARARQETGEINGAIAAYSDVWAIENAPIRITAFAIKTWMQLLWNRNRPDDRKVAHQTGLRYLEATRPLAPKMTPEETSLWQEIETFVKSQSPDAP